MPAITFRNSGRDEESAVAHDLLFTCLRFKPDVEAEPDNIDVGAGAPRGAGVLAVWIAERNVDAGEFLILKNVADDPLNAEIGANREFADPVGVFVGVRVRPEIRLELFVGTRATDNAIRVNPDRERRRGKQAVASA